MKNQSIGYGKISRLVTRDRHHDVHCRFLYNLVSVVANEGMCQSSLIFADTVKTWEPRWNKLNPEETSNSVTDTLCMLQKCRKNGNLEYAVHIQAYHCGLIAHSTIGNYIVPMLVECSGVSIAQHAFDSLLQRNEHSWTSLIVGYINCGQLHHAFTLYNKMLADNVLPSHCTFTALLKGCVRFKNMAKGRQLHDEIKSKGFERDLSVGNTLVHMYARCTLLSEAQEVFDKLPVRDLVSWNVLLTGYVDNGCSEEALKCLERMELDGISPNAVTFVSILKACGTIGNICRGREVHVEILGKGVEGNVIVGNSLLDMYAKCGSLLEVEEVFDKLPVQDVITWTTLISGFTEYGYGQEGLHFLERMQLEGMSPNAVTYICGLKACGIIGAIDKGREIHNRILQKGLETDTLVGNILIDMYAKCGSLSEARQVFDKLSVRDLVSWKTLIAGYVENELDQEALKCFEQLQQETIALDAVTFIYGLKACGNRAAIDKGRKIHTEIFWKGFHKDVYVGNTLLGMYVKCGSLRDANKVFDNLPILDVVSWNTLIAGYAEHGLGNEAFNCFECMQVQGLTPNLATFICSLRACGNMSVITKARKIHAQIRQGGYDKDIFIGNTLIDIYGKCCSLVEVLTVFIRLPIQDIVSWTALIAGYVELGYGQEALRCFSDMQLTTLYPNEATFVCILRACTILKAIDKGREIHTSISQRGFEEVLSVGSTLVDMYAKCGKLSDAQEAFEKLSTRDVVSWNALIGGYSDNGLGEEALECFEQMQLDGVPPDAFTFSCSLKACSIGGCIDKGRKLHSEVALKGLETDYFIASGLIDMYVKGGSLFEAHQVFKKLTIRNVALWNALISGYAENGHGLEALQCLEQMQHDGVLPDAVTFISSLKACGIIGAIDRGQEIHARLAETGFERDLVVGNTLIGMYIKCGSVAGAREVFDKLPVRDAVTWTGMIRGYGMNHEINMAIQCFQEMQEHGFIPDDTTFVCLLTACSRASLVTKGREYFQVMIKEYGIAPSIDHYTCMVDLFARSGYLHEAENLLKSGECTFPKETWLAFLNACKTYKDTELGSASFDQLVQRNVEHAASYVLLSNIYSEIPRTHMEAKNNCRLVASL